MLHMNLSVTSIFRGSKSAKCVLQKKAHVLLFRDANKQVRYKSTMTKSKAIEINKYRQSKELEPIGLYGYSILVSNSDKLNVIEYLEKGRVYHKILYITIYIIVIKLYLQYK